MPLVQREDALDGAGQTGILQLRLVLPHADPVDSGCRVGLLDCYFSLCNPIAAFPFAALFADGAQQGNGRSGKRPEGELTIRTARIRYHCTQPSVRTVCPTHVTLVISS